MRIPDVVKYEVLYKFRCHIRVNRLKLFFIFYITWILNKLLKLKIEMYLVEK